MSVVPAASVRLGNEVFDAQLERVTVTLTALPGVSSFECTLPAAADVAATPGDPASLELDGGDGASTVLTGKIRAIRNGFRERRFTAADGGAALAALRPAATYERRNAKDIVQSLAGDAGVDVGRVDLDVGLAAYVADQGRTAAEHVAYLAALGGASANVDAEGALTVAAPPPTADVALRYGRELLTYDVREQPVPDVRLVAVGAGPAGSADAAEALRHTLDPLAGGEPQPGVDAVWTATPVLRTPAAAGAASRAANERAAAEATTLRARCILLPELRPGTVVEVQELPDGLAGGPWTLTRVLHRFHPEHGGSTTLEARSAGGGAPGGLGALGGLL
ncbi:MAG TPA: hypothetical protein VGJ77_20120 [Gaiellaceae bacterium]|jgi:hypothetical protein